MINLIGSVLVVLGLIGVSVAYYRLRKVAKVLIKEFGKLTDENDRLEKQVQGLYDQLDVMEREFKLSRFRVGMMYNVLDYIRKIKNTEDPKYYLEVSASMADEAINKCKLTVDQVGNRMAHF